jgi:molecular chaperone DnaJ
VNGKGAPRLKGLGRGHLYVRAKVVVPSKLSAEEREILTRLSKTGRQDVRKGIVE